MNPNVKPKRFVLNVILVAVGYLLAGAIALPAQSQRQASDNPFARMDKNKDGKLSKEEFKGPERAFGGMDADNDSLVSKEEMRIFHQKHSGPKTGGVKNEDEGPYPALIVKKYDKDKAWRGNVIFVDKNRNRVVEAGLDGKIGWECKAPEAATCDLAGRSCGSRLTDVELLPGDNLLVLSGGAGVYEINRKGEAVWSFHNPNISHDADRLRNGNTLMACVGAEKASEFPYRDPQALEVNRQGETVWAWYAKTEYAAGQYKDIRSKDADDWTHMNSVQRLKDGNTLLSVRNWNLLIAVDGKGATVWKTGADELPQPGGWGAGSPHCPHTAVMLDNGNIIISEPINGRVIEWDPKEAKVVWRYPDKSWRQGGPYYFIRAAHRLPNGNTFIIDSLGQFLEVTPDNNIVWHAQLAGYMPRSTPPDKEEIGKAPCFNADRRGLPFYGGR